MMQLLLAAAAAAAHAATPTTMRAVRQTKACNEPFTCVKIDTVQTPKPQNGQALIQINASSVNPSDVDGIEYGGCTQGCGNDLAGVVMSCPGCARLKAGDQVWGFGGPSYADYTAAPEQQVGLKPASLSFSEAATIPEVGLTSLFSLKRTGVPPSKPMPTGSPWTKANLTVVITAGQGGTGFIGIEIAKAYGAAHIATAATGADGIAFVKSLGADFVTDYKKQDIFDALPDNSVDIVYDNYGAEGTADKAMHAIRPGGTYLLMPHGECYSSKVQGPPCLSANPKAGVTQLNYVTGPDYEAYALQGLDEMRALFEAGKLSAHIDKSFPLADIAKAFSYSAGPGEGGVGDHIGKISVTSY